MNKNALMVLFIIVMCGLLMIPGCEKKPEYNIVGKWATTIKYSSGEAFTPRWTFKEDGTFYEYVEEPWGTYSVRGDQVKITSSDGKQYYSGTFSSQTHMIGKLVYVGFEDKGPSVTWEAVKVDE